MAKEITQLSISQLEARKNSNFIFLLILYGMVLLNLIVGFVFNYMPLLLIAFGVGLTGSSLIIMRRKIIRELKSRTAIQ